MNPEIETLYVGIDVDGPQCRMIAVDMCRKLIVRRSIACDSVWSILPSARRTIIGIEYRSNIHELGHRLMQAGFEVKLIRFRDIPQLRIASSDADYDRAGALCEVVRMGSSRDVPILAPSEQGRAVSQRVKALLNRQRSAVLNAARSVVESVEGGQEAKFRNEQELVRRLHSIAKTDSYSRVSTALLDVLSTLKGIIADLEGEPRFETPLDRSFPSIEDDDVGAEPDGETAEGPQVGFSGRTLSLSRPRVIPIDRVSDIQGWSSSWTPESDAIGAASG